MYSNIYIYTYYIHGKKHGLGDLRTPLGNGRPRLTRLRDRTPGTDATDAMISLGIRETQPTSTKDIQR